jgi:hypothetical protein
MTTVSDGLYQYGGVPVESTVNVFGNTWFVDCTNGHDENTGKSPSLNYAFKTIAKAIERGAAYDNIILSPGTHSVDVSASALVPKEGMQFKAAIPPLGAPPTTIITQDADDGVNLVTVDVNNVGFYGIKFLHVAGGAVAVNLVNISATTSVSGITFKDCWFDQNSVDIADVSAICATHATNTVTGMVVKDCTFVGADATTGVPTYINIGVGGVPNMLVEHNIFLLEAIGGDCAGIRMADPTGALKSYGFVIRNNDFIGPDDNGCDALGMVVAAATEGELIGMVRQNYFSSCVVTSVSQDMFSKSIVGNYVGDLTIGGTLVIPGT